MTDTPTDLWAVPPVRQTGCNSEASMNDSWLLQNSMNHSFSWLQFPAEFTSVKAKLPSADGGFQRSVRFLSVCVVGSAGSEQTLQTTSESVLNCRMLNSLCFLFIVQLQNKTQLGEPTPLYLNPLQDSPSARRVNVQVLNKCSSFFCSSRLEWRNKVSPASQTETEEREETNCFSGWIRNWSNHLNLKMMFTKNVCRLERRKSFPKLNVSVCKESYFIQN